MEFITAEQFLKEDKEVQNVFLDWWKPSIGDLIYVFKSDCYTHDYLDVIVNVSKESVEGTDVYENLNDILPLLTEGQLRQFIEDKTGYIIEMIPKIHYEKETGKEKIVYEADLKYFNSMDFEPGDYIETKESVLLQAYWKVACKIAKESLKQ